MERARQISPSLGLYWKLAAAPYAQLRVTLNPVFRSIDPKHPYTAAMLYHVYIDDSSDGQHKKVIAAGAVVGTFHQWKAVSKRWNGALVKRGIKYFRNTDYYSFRGEFFAFRDEAKYPPPQGKQAASELFETLQKILGDEGVVAIASVIPLEMFHREVEKWKLEKTFNPNPFSAAMQTVMNEAAILVRDQLPGKEKRVAFVCDDGPDSDKLTAAYASFKQKNVQLSGLLSGIAHWDDKVTPPLQAADMVAGLAKEIQMKHLESGKLIDLPRLHGVFYRLFTWNEETFHQAATQTIALDRAMSRQSRWR